MLPFINVPSIMVFEMSEGRKTFRALFKAAFKRFFSGVYSDMRGQIPLLRKGLLAVLIRAHKWFLSSLYKII
jgi:hypothetical protein